MAEFCFLVGTGAVSKADAKRCEAIARRHGGHFLQCLVDGGQRHRHWFEVPNRGAPVDGARKAAVEADLEQAGLLDRDGRLRRARR